MLQEMYAEEGASAAKKPWEANEKKNVLLIGDSIRMGYCETVRQALSDVANVFYPEENCRDTHHVIISLRAWLAACPAEALDVVLLNCGHWDVAHWNDEEESLSTPSHYAENLGRIMEALGRKCPRAKIVFATTTPMNPDGSMSVNFRTTEEICRFNEAAKPVAQEKHVAVLDLYEKTADWGPEEYADYCHFTPEAFARLGGMVADFLRGMLTGKDA